MSNKFIPNSFQVPNVLVDAYIEELSSHSFKLMLFIIRKTRGWQKQKDAISATQLAKVVGLKKIKSVYPYIKELEALNLIKVHKKLGRINQYSLGTNFDRPVPNKGTTKTETSPEKGYTPVPNKGTTTSPEKGYSTKGTIKTTNNKKLFFVFYERWKSEKRELETEYQAFKLMHKDWKEILPKLVDVILKEPNENYPTKLKNYLYSREWESAKRVKAPNWWDTKESMIAKGKEYGLIESDYTQFPAFYKALKSKAIQHGDLVYE
jgi:phage replication O-like protein O